MPSKPKKTTSKKTWIKVKDSQVLTHWECPECGDKSVAGPDFFQDNGTPVCCTCDMDMDYSHTEICQ